MTASPQKAVQSIGANITLSCSAESSPPAEFEWFLNGESQKKTGQEVKLEDLQENQSGNYSCQASNPKTMRFLASDVSKIMLLGESRQQLQGFLVLSETCHTGGEGDRRPGQGVWSLLTHHERQEAG